MLSPDDLFFFNQKCRFPYLRKSERIPTEKLPDALQEFRLTGVVSSGQSNSTLKPLKEKEKNKQNVNFDEHGESKKDTARKKRKRAKRFETDFPLDFDVEDDGKFLFEEAKYSSTTLLDELGRHLQTVWERIVFQNNWNKQGNGGKLKFERDIKGFKWRFEITDQVNEKSFFIPEHIFKLLSNVEYQDLCRSVQYKEREWQTQAYKDITRFTSGALKRTDSGIFSVPPTRMSEATMATIVDDENGDDSIGKVKELVGKSSNDSGMTHGSDGPAIISYRRESNAPIYFIPKAEVKHVAKVSIAKGPHRTFHGEGRIGVNKASKAGEEDSGDKETHMTKFSLGSKECYQKGWMSFTPCFNEHEKKAINVYLRKILTEAIARREDEELMNSRKFINPDIIIHEYGDAKEKAASLYQASPRAKKHMKSKKKNKLGIPFMVTLRDGSFAIFYPSGNICAINSFAPGNPKKCYFIVYGDSDVNNVILAHFTPMGCGVCYHKNGKIAFISTPKYACCHDEVGAMTKKWLWTGRKLTPCYVLKLSRNLTFRCSNQDSMALFVNIDGESTKIKLIESKTLEDGEEDSSLLQGKQKMQRRKKKYYEDLDRLHLSDSAGMVSLESELVMLRDKFRNTVKSWMDHYRIALGIKAPVNKKLLCKSAGSVPSSKAPEGTRSPERRKLSAPVRSSVFSEQGSSDGLYSDDSAICLKKLPFRCGVLQSPGAGLPKKGCPAVYRLQLMGVTDTHCRCDRKVIPIITDIEFDGFLASLPKSQLIVVSVFKERTSNPFDGTLNEIHYFMNKDRSFPCVQSSCDPFRLFRYPIPAQVKHGKTSLLVERHKVAPGMFIMYLAGKLLYSDYIFDGYGYTKKDFLNQITRTRKEALDEKYLPDDFRFSPRPHSPRTHKIREYSSGESVFTYNSQGTVYSSETVNLEEVDANRNSPTENESGIPTGTSVSFMDSQRNQNEIQSIS